jgi:hypothetical protein
MKTSISCSGRKVVQYYALHWIILSIPCTCSLACGNKVQLQFVCKVGCIRWDPNLVLVLS